MELTEFLLARITEDESNGTDLVGVARKDWHARWVAECNAKRWIVEAKPADSYGEDVWTSHALALASVYDDHPDYQQKWKLEYVGKCPPHEWTDRGTPGDYWRECWLCGAQTAAKP